MVERTTGRVKFIVAENLSIKLINKLVVEHTEGPLTVYTDDYNIYNGLVNLNIVLDHRVVKHSCGIFADGDNHINTAEGIHSRLRVFLRVHRGANRGNLQLYVSLFAFYHNSGRKWLESLIKACLNKQRLKKVKR